MMLQNHSLFLYKAFLFFPHLRCQKETTSSVAFVYIVRSEFSSLPESVSRHCLCCPEGWGPLVAPTEKSAGTPVCGRPHEGGCSERSTGKQVLHKFPTAESSPRSAPGSVWDLTTVSPGAMLQQEDTFTITTSQLDPSHPSEAGDGCCGGRAPGERAGSPAQHQQRASGSRSSRCPR